MKRIAAAWVLLSCMAGWTVQAEPPAEIDYQGKVLVNDLPFTGDGRFKFAIANEDGSLNHWASDGTAVGEPSGILTNSVFNGVFSTVLGAPPMSPINPAIFGLATDLYLRVWFSQTDTGFTEMLPAQKVVSVPYALNAGLVGGLSATEIENNSVAAATNAITLDGDVTGPPHANTLGAGVVYDSHVNASANIDGTKIAQGTTGARGTLRLAIGSTGTTAIATGHPALNNFGVVNTLIAAAPNSALIVTGIAPVYVSNQAPNIVQIGIGSLPSSSLALMPNVIWVATNGTLAGPGTIDRPYDSPQNGYNAAAMLFMNQPAVVAIAAGTYYGSLTMTSSNVHILGFNRPYLDSLTVTVPADTSLSCKQRVEDVILGSCTVAASGGGVKFHNLQVLNCLYIYGSDVEVQNCYIRSIQDGQPALIVGSGSAIARRIGIYHSAIEQTRIQGATALLVNDLVYDFEVLWSEIINPNGWAISDQASMQLQPVHLYAHNYIKGPYPTSTSRAVQDGTASATIGFFNNTVVGNVGTAGGNPASHSQYFANNIVFGIINYPGSGVLGWVQLGAGTGADAANNTEHELVYPVLANEYRD
jgi:hypothetical protein